MKGAGQKICYCVENGECQRNECLLGTIPGLSNILFKLLKNVRSMIHSSAPVLITGESGTGKELFARSLHYSPCSERKDAPFLVKNCSGFDYSKGLTKSFAHETKGIFANGLELERKSFFELRGNETLFFDEIGDLAEEHQMFLLNMLEEHQVYTVLDKKKRALDFRVIAATNKNLVDLIDQGKFREDLYYRLNVLSLHIPPLRERREDIVPIALDFLKKLAVRNEVKEYTLTVSAMKDLMNYPWPGNVRELQNALLREVLNLPLGETTISNMRTGLLCVPYEKVSEKHYELLKDTNEEYNVIKPLKEVEREAIIQALIILKGNRNKTAQFLGISRNTLYKKIKQYNIHYD